MKTYVIGACLKAENNPFWSIDVRKGLEEASKNFSDIRLLYDSPDRITYVKEQDKIITKFIKQKVDAIILAPSDPIKLIASVKKINRAKIPLIVIDSKLDEKKSGNLKFTFIGFDDYKGGFETGELLKKKLSQGSNIAVIQGYKVGSYTKRVDGFVNSVRGYFNIKEILSANFEEDEAYQKTKLLIEKYPNLNGIFCTSDNMAMGCITALFELNRQDIIISGFDATHAGRLALQNGKLYSTINTDPEGIGRKAIQTAREIIFAYEVPHEINYYIQPLTKEKLRKPPKQVILKRKYILTRPLENLREFNYESLHESEECPIIIGGNIWKDLAPRLKKLNADRYYILTDNNVKRLYGEKLLSVFKNEGFNSKLFAIPAGEKNKTFTNLNTLATRILNLGVSKNSCLVLFGGGVVGNIAGFLSAILMRGIRFVHVPTTVMAQIDSTTGGKQGINMPHGKNLLGTFYEPEFIFIDKTLIKTLSEKEYNSGIAEAIKHGLCQSRKLLDYIKEKDYDKILEETIKLKINVLEVDPREKKDALVLVYGHTIGHVLEILSDHKLNHGEAISIGMVAAVRISNQLGFCNKEFVELHEKIFKETGLPIKIPKYIKLNDIYKVLLYDKKDREKIIPFVLLEDIEKVKTINGNYAVPVRRKIIDGVLKSML